MFAKIRNILLDRDGTLIKDLHYLSDPEQVSLLPGVGKGLYALQVQGYRLFLVTNQSGIGRGYFTTNAYQACQKKLRGLLRAYQVELTAETYCPHAPETRCSCRKPKTAQWENLADNYGLKTEETILIGDKGTDIEFALNCDLNASILVLSGKGKQEATKMGFFQEQSIKRVKNISPLMHPGFLASDFSAACTWILQHDDESGSMQFIP